MTLTQKKIKKKLRHFYTKKNRFDDFEELFQMEFLEGEIVYACNVCNEGLDTENDVKKHIITHHEDILQTIRNKSEDDLKNPDGKKIVCN